MAGIAKQKTNGKNSSQAKEADFERCAQDIRSFGPLTRNTSSLVIGARSKEAEEAGGIVDAAMRQFDEEKAAEARTELERKAGEEKKVLEMRDAIRCLPEKIDALYPALRRTRARGASLLLASSVAAVSVLPAFNALGGMGILMSEYAVFLAVAAAAVLTPLGIHRVLAGWEAKRTANFLNSSLEYAKKAAAFADKKDAEALDEKRHEIWQAAKTYANSLAEALNEAITRNSKMAPDANRTPLLFYGFGMAASGFVFPPISAGLYLYAFISDGMNLKNVGEGMKRLKTEENGLPFCEKTIATEIQQFARHLTLSMAVALKEEKSVEPSSRAGRF